MKNNIRVEKDILGEIEIPNNVYWGLNTQRAIENFQISGRTFPLIFIKSLILVKKACLLANLELKLINDEIGGALQQAINEILEENKLLDQFPIDIFQTGSGTQTNMNANEVLSNRANEILGFPLGNKYPVHPNDHVNKGQSSNDVIPTTMHLSLLYVLQQRLFPTISKLKNELENKIKQFDNIVKVGRTHLQDAVPIPLSLEFEVYLQQLKTNEQHLKNAFEELCYVPIGGTALGTGINTHRDFAHLVVSKLSDLSGFSIKLNPVLAEGIASHSAIVYTSSCLRLLALSLLKVANDIRWMGSGPRAGLCELILPSNEPGSSIMPGKINPTQSEALIQVCLQVIGNDTIISYAESYGSVLDLNVCKPIMIYSLLESNEILSAAIDSFIKHCLKDLKPNLSQINFHLERSLMTVTNLIPIIGYDKASEIVQKAYKEGKTIKEVLLEMDLEFNEDIDELLDPKRMV